MSIRASRCRPRFRDLSAAALLLKQLTRMSIALATIIYIPPGEELYQRPPLFESGSKLEPKALHSII